MISDREVAVAAALAGAQVVRAGFGGALARFDKGAGDFATAADLEAEQAILGVLRQWRPDDAVTGEETGRTGAAGTKRRWLVDPLCGTLNYAAQTALVAVNVALPAGAVAAVADPFTHEVFWTGGGGAHVRHGDAHDRDRPLRPSADSRLIELNLDPPFTLRRIVRLSADPRFLEAGFRPRVLSTTLPLAWVAAGRRAAYLTEGDVSDSVHFAAGITLCRAAGCVVTDLRGGPVESGDGLLAAADAGTHETLLKLF